MLWWVLCWLSVVWVFSYQCVCLFCVFDCVGELCIVCVCYLCGWGDCLIFESGCVVLGCVGVLLANPCIVFQRVCVLCLWSQCVSRCSLHMSDLCVCMRDYLRFVLWCCFCVQFCVLCVLEVVFMWVHLAFWDVMFVCVEDDVSENGVCSVYV